MTPESDRHSSRSRWWRGKYGIGTINAMFVLLLVAGVFLLSEGGFDPPDAPVPDAQPLSSLLILVLAIPPVAVLLTIATRWDKKCAEDYVYQLMANAAMVGVTTTLCVSVLWDLANALGVPGLRDPVAGDMIGVLLLGFGTGYFAFRVRGLR